MKASLSWLKEYVNIAFDAETLADALTMVGLEVETVSDRYDYLKSVVTGRIAQILPHPNSNELKLCQVDIGSGTIPVVCGAPNVTKDMLAPCALPGTCLPNGIILDKNLIKGEPSEGMLCSEIELGLGVKGDSIIELSKDISPGEPLNKALGLSDMVFEIDLTPNRPDCLSIIGVAREIAAIQKTKVAYPEIHQAESFDDIFSYTSVTLVDPDLCPRYAAGLVFDIAIKPSPFWLRDRLISVGLKPINNIVDITNFVMMETGQPLHAFDFDRLEENRIVVRTALKGEVLTTLDEKERHLDQDMLMICDGKKPVALAGIMGGLHSEIEDSTSRVLIESANFDPVCIRKTAKKTGLNTDASHRFERGVDPHGTTNALNRALRLITEICGGKLIKGVVDEFPNPISDRNIAIGIKALNRRLGTDLEADDIATYLESIEFDVEQTDLDTLRILPPSFRVDITRFEDIAEEVARLHGYNNIETTFPLIPAGNRLPSIRIDVRDRLKDLMTGLGFTEAINYSFISKSSYDRLELKPDDPKRKVVNIMNPLSEDQSVMRTSLIPGLIETMKYNLSVQNKNVKLFEIGNTFFDTGHEDTQPDEVEILAGLWTGTRVDAAWFSKEIESDFFDLKGVVEELLRNLGVVNIKYTRLPPESCIYTKPGYSAQVFLNNEPIGIIGELHPKVRYNYDLKPSAFIFELNFDKLLSSIPRVKSAKPVSKFPGTSRDISMIIDKDIETQNILQCVKLFDEKWVENLHIFDVFEGDPIPAGKKSLSFRITYRSESETLEVDKINQIHKNITRRLLKEFDATLPAI
jgi:phenylalanyl-tRNA synthetase beta chain